MNDVVLDVPTPEQMRTFGRALGRAAWPGDRFLLEGPFGAGKTTFVQGLADGLDVPTPVSSPSFVIENQYRGRLMLYHVDLYRLARVEAELWQSLEEHLYGDGVTAVEWAERLPDQLREGATLLRFELCEPGRRVALLSPEQRLRSAAAAA
jgi:tRNA threonylcarbamoyladenosine biosynthesis protein TsaE